MTATEMHLHSPFSPPPTQDQMQTAACPLPRHVSPGPGEGAGVCSSLHASSPRGNAGCGAADREEGLCWGGLILCTLHTRIDVYDPHPPATSQQFGLLSFNACKKWQTSAWHPLEPCCSKAGSGRTTAAPAQPPSLLCMSPIYHIPPGSWKQTRYLADNDN